MSPERAVASGWSCDTRESHSGQKGPHRSQGASPQNALRPGGADPGWYSSWLRPRGAVGDVHFPLQGHFHVAAGEGHYFPLQIGLAALRRCCLSLCRRKTVFLVILEARALPPSVRLGFLCLELSRCMNARGPSGRVDSERGWPGRRALRGSVPGHHRQERGCQERPRTPSGFN